MPGAYAAIGAPIVSKSAAEQVVTAPVLVPDSPDRERHRYSPETVARVANSFLPEGGIDAEHFGAGVGHPVESYVAPQDIEIGGRRILAGSWVVSTKVTDSDVWGRVETGEITGMSVQGPVAAVYDSEGRELPKDEWAVRVGSPDARQMATSRPPSPAAAASTAVKSPGLAAQGIQWTIAPAPVGEVWDVELARADFVSLVGEPAVSEARFVVAKSAVGAGGSDGSGQYNGTEDDIIMNDELKQRLEKIQNSVEESATAAKAAAESAEQAQQAAASAEEASEASASASEGTDDENGGSDADPGVSAVEALRADLESAGVLGDGGDPSDDDSGAVNETLRTLVEAGVVDPADLDSDEIDIEFDADELSEISPALEKRLASIEKSLQGSGRRGRASQLDLGSGDGDESGTLGQTRDFAGAVAGGSGANAESDD